MRGPQLGLHVNTCLGSFTKADWEAWRNRGWREQREAEFGHLPDTEEGLSFVTCALCGMRFHQLAEHLVTAHGTTARQYRKATGGLTMASGVTDRRKATLVERYGVDHQSKVDGFYARVLATIIERHGPEYAAEFAVRRAETNTLRYGDAHPIRLDWVQAKVRASNQESFGTDYYFTSDAFKAWSMAKYGTPNPMGNRDYVLELFRKISPSRPGPNKFEQRVWDLAPSLIFTGNWVWWRYLPKFRSPKHFDRIGGHKNPDFLVPGPDPEHPYCGVTKVVEAFGDYHHGKRRTGRLPAVNEQELIDAYADIGIQCLILWESEVKTDPEGVRARLVGFCR